MLHGTINVLAIKLTSYLRSKDFIDDNLGILKNKKYKVPID